MAPQLHNLRPMLTNVDTRVARLPVKLPDLELLTAAHRTWREAVVARAGRRCEWLEHGVRCERAAPAHRLFADHIVERKDGGAPLDVTNGQCLCASHHGLKTFQERARRMARPT